MPRAKRAWSKVIEEAGISVRVYERTIGSLLAREVRINGAKDRKSLGHRDRALAEQQARALAKRLAELRFAGHTGRVTLGQVVALFRQHRLPQLSEARQRTLRGMFALLERHFGRDLALDDLAQPHIDGYVKARRSGTLRSERHRVPEPGVRDGTIRNELHAFLAMLHWATQHRVGGRRLLGVDPGKGLKIPSEKNANRPVASEARYQALLTVAGQVEPTGRFRCVLTLARHTGRRINAICHLRRSDLLLNRKPLERALASRGEPLANADAWPYGAIRWPSWSDKLGYDEIAPLSAAARAELDRYLEAHPMAGDVPLFPGREDKATSVGKEIAGYWLTRAEIRAELPKFARGSYHPFRRLWASERRHLPAQDVAKAGGWRSLEVMRTAYQHHDAATVYAVVERPQSSPAPEKERGKRRRGHTLDTPQRQA